MSEPTNLDRRSLVLLGAGAAAAAGCHGPAHDPARGASMHDPEPSAGTDDLDALFADLTDQSARHAPISDDEKRARQARVATELAALGLDALLIEAGSTLRYLSDVTWGSSERLFALCMLADGSSFWVCPAFEAPRAERKIAAGAGPGGPIVAWDEHEYAWRPLAAELQRRGVERIAIEPRARAFVAQSLAEELGPTRVVGGTEVVRNLRGRKDAHELALLRAANELTQLAIQTVSKRLRPGMTDHDLGRWIRTAQERLGLRGCWVLPLIGPGAAFPHGRPEGRELARGDLILVDTGGSLHGYQSDNTRTWIFDAAPSREITHGWNTVRDAQRRAFEAMRPGVPCREIDAVARRVIEDAGFGKGYTDFAHRLGHGIGLDGHEEPYFDGGNALPLAPGMTFSDEPGVYLPGKYGIRIEDIVCITADGADHFGEWQASPRSPQGGGA